MNPQGIHETNPALPFAKGLWVNSDGIHGKPKGSPTARVEGLATHPLAVRDERGYFCTCRRSVQAFLSILVDNYSGCV